MPTQAVKLIVESGMIPKEALKQLEEWKLLPEGSAEQAGSHQVSLEAGWPSVKAFVDRLNRIITKEADVIRETEYVSPGKPVVVVVKMKGRPKHEGEAYQDRLGRIYLDSRFCGKNIDSIAVNGKPPRLVMKVEERYDGDLPSRAVCYLKEEP